MSHHRCNCCATLDCQQPGPCCEPPESDLGYGRCTPRGYVKQSDGSWSGSAPTSIHGSVSAVGVIKFAKAVRNFGTEAGVVRNWDVPFAFDNADPRARVILTGGAANEPCSDFNGAMEWVDGYDQDDPDDTLEDLTCAFPLSPVVQIVRSLRANVEYTPKGDLATPFSWGGGGSGGALGYYVVTVEAWECRVELRIGVGRPAGRPPGYPAVPRAEATISLGNLGGVPVTAVIGESEAIVQGYTLSPCGTKVRVTINKPLNATPLQQEAEIDDWCDPLTGIIEPGVCRVCRAVGIEMTVEVDLADLFTACEKCDLIVESACCNGAGMFMPNPRLPPSGGSAWEPTGVTVSTSRVIELHEEAGTYTYTLTGSLSDEIDWNLGCPQGLAVGDNVERTVTTGPGGPFPDSVGDLRVFAQVFPGGGGGGPPGSSLPWIRLMLTSALYGGPGVFQVDIPTDPAFTTVFATIDYEGDPRFVVSRDISRWGRSVRVTETVESRPGTGIFQRHSMSMRIGPLFPCVLPDGGGEGGGDSLRPGSGGGSGGGCSGCGGGVA